MSDHDTTPEIDADRVIALVGKYRAAKSRQERRQIEDDVLEATVWSCDDAHSSQEKGYELSRSELQTIYSALRDGDASEGAKLIVRSKFVEDL